VKNYLIEGKPMTLTRVNLDLSLVPAPQRQNLLILFEIAVNKADELLNLFPDFSALARTLPVAGDNLGGSPL